MVNRSDAKNRFVAAMREVVEACIAQHDLERRMRAARNDEWTALRDQLTTVTRSVDMAWTKMREVLDE